MITTRPLLLNVETVIVFHYENTTILIRVKYYENNRTLASKTIIGELNDAAPAWGR